MTAKTQELAPWVQSVQLAEKKFNQVLPTGSLMKYQKEAEFAMQAIEKNEKLKECDGQSLVNSVVNVASVGLSLNPATKHAYLVPRGGLAVLDISYKGLVRLATDCGGIIWAKAILVYEGDKFEMHGVNRMPTHDYDPFAVDRTLEKVIGGYCVAELSNGTHLIDTMPRSELDKVKDTSKAKKGPWQTWPTEMMKKSLIKRASKSWPETPQMERFHTAVDVLNQHEGLEDKEIKEADVIDMPVARETVTATGTKPSSETTVEKSGAVNQAKEKHPEAIEGELVNETPAETRPEPLTDNMVSIIVAQLQNKNLTEADCVKAFDCSSIEQIRLDQVNAVLNWIKGQ